MRFVNCHVTFMFSLGTITTSPTFYALLNVLQCHPDIQEKLYQEVVREVGTDKAVDLDQKEKLPYVRAVVQELLRFVTSTGIGAVRETIEDTELSGIPVPKGTQVREYLYGLVKTDTRVA